MVNAPSLSAVYRSVNELETPAQIAAAVGALSLIASFLAFVFAPTYVAFPFIAFIVVTVYGWVAYQAETARALTLLTTISTVVILGLITAYLFIQSFPVFRKMGIGLIMGTVWNTNTNRYALFTMMWGTFITTIIAALVAAPLGIAGAIFISEIASDTVREVTKPAIELLAGIPSIVYGYIGFIVLNPYMMQELNLPTGGSLFLVGLVIGFMALPTVVSVAEDSMTAVPNSMQSGAVALGATDWQTTKSVTLPAAMSGISAAVILGIGRAIGETMAATVILANVIKLPQPLYDVFGNTITLTSLIASQSGVAAGRQMQLDALFAAGVVLFVTVLSLSLVSQAIERRMARKLGGNQ